MMASTSDRPQASSAEKTRRIIELFEQLREWGRERLAREAAERQANDKPTEPGVDVSEQTLDEDCNKE